MKKAKKVKKIHLKIKKKKKMIKKVKNQKKKVKKVKVGNKVLKLLLLIKLNLIQVKTKFQL